MTTRRAGKHRVGARAIPRRRRYSLRTVGLVSAIAGMGVLGVAVDIPARVAGDELGTDTQVPGVVASDGNTAPSSDTSEAVTIPGGHGTWSSPQPSASSTPLPDPSRSRLVATTADPAVLWVVGDSLTETFGPALVDAALATSVLEPHHQLRYSSGLTRPDFFDWPHRLRELLTSPVDIVVFMIGANDAQAIHNGASWVEFGTEAWLEEYRRRVAATADLLASRSRTVYWVGQPIARPTGYGERMALLNSVYADVADGHAAIRYVSSWELFSSPDGGYSADLPNEDGLWVRVRGADGIHLTTSGGGRLAAHLLDVIEQDWDLRRTDD